MNQPPPPPPFPGEVPAKTRSKPSRPLDGQTLRTVLTDRFGFAAFREHQEEVCRAAGAGEDVLLVMPTGSGKSLCYQLPGLLRGGSTLVISPLIALMEDQVLKLREAGIAADRLHSGRSRDEAAAAAQGWRQGRLDFLFVAPERLAFDGFTALVRETPPTLVAVDEAHCISHWGHDFRPEYRQLAELRRRLPGAAIHAFTATATPLVQRDIVEQLAIPEAKNFIHGFRRTGQNAKQVECLDVA